MPFIAWPNYNMDYMRISGIVPSLVIQTKYCKMLKIDALLMPKWVEGKKEKYKTIFFLFHHRDTGIGFVRCQFDHESYIREMQQRLIALFVHSCVSSWLHGCCG